MSGDRWDALLDRDWSEAWETLSEAPDLVPRAKTAQITLRLPAAMLARVKRVASAPGAPVPYAGALVAGRGSAQLRRPPDRGA